VPYLIHLEEGALSHLLQGADFASVCLSSKVNLTVSSLPYLGDNVELINL
jgi:hypothetical protein